MPPNEAYRLSVEGGIKCLRRKIEEAAALGLTRADIYRLQFVAPEVIDHYKSLGYEFDEYTNSISWGHARSAGFNQ